MMMIWENWLKSALLILMIDIHKMCRRCQFPHVFQTFFVTFLACFFCICLLLCACEMFVQLFMLSFSCLQSATRLKRNNMMQANVQDRTTHIITKIAHLALYRVSQQVWDTLRNVWERSELRLQKKIVFCSKKLLFEPFL